jgi:hypothetical protein
MSLYPWGFHLPLPVRSKQTHRQREAHGIHFVLDLEPVCRTEEDPPSLWGSPPRSRAAPASQEVRTQQCDSPNPHGQLGGQVHPFSTGLTGRQPLPAFCQYWGECRPSLPCSVPTTHSLLALSQTLDSHCWHCTWPQVWPEQSSATPPGSPHPQPCALQGTWGAAPAALGPPLFLSVPFPDRFHGHMTKAFVALQWSHVSLFSE